MKFMIVCCLLVCSITAALGAKADCVVGDQNFMAGEKYYPPGECIALECDENGGLSGSGCPVEFNNNPKCTLVPEDNSKQFPYCCEHYDCE